MRLFNYEVTLHFRALRSWLDPKLFRHEYYTHFVWGKISLIWGQPHLEPINVCKACSSEVQGIGDDGISYCNGCEHIVEGETEEITMEEYEARHS